MNGGGNQPTNLATLCVPCHDEKTAMDRSLKRQREKTGVENNRRN